VFGIYRYFLAAMVALSHLYPGRFYWVGFYSVFGFYLLSGFLMTRVLHETYGLGLEGIGRFLLNRALRVYPAYYAALVLALVVVVTIPDATFTVISRYIVRGSPWDYVRNVVLLGLDHGTRVKWIPPAWSLHVELAFYLAMPLLLARSRATTIIWLVASLAYVVHAVRSGALPSERYFPIAAASLPFSIGSLIYWLRGHLPSVGGGAAAAVCALFAAHLLCASMLWHAVLRVVMQGFYVSLGLAALATFALQGADAWRCPQWLRRADAFLGDLTYPLFVCHFHVGALVWWLFPAGRDPRLRFYALALVASTIIAWLMHTAIERPLARLRSTLRARRREGQRRSATLADSPP
jgi:peptidoglycan/LPS O-acetylase OafA/YrhL